MIALFIDDGGVMNNNMVRATNYQSLVGEFFAPVLGGAQSTWSVANRTVFSSLIPMLEVGPQEQNFKEWFDQYLLKWLQGMAACAGVPTPEDDEQCIRLAREALWYITHHTRSAYPGAAEAVRKLYNGGFKLFTSSGETALELEGYTNAMGIRDCFEKLYGADIINQGKYSVEYYRMMFAHAGVRPREALVVDDNPKYLDWAAGLGAVTCLVSSSKPVTKTHPVISSLAQLPEMIKRIG
jgi:HAD superfamily hydrolase (TIGR01509 family)